MFVEPAPLCIPPVQSYALEAVTASVPVNAPPDCVMVLKVTGAPVLKLDAFGSVAPVITRSCTGGGAGKIVV
jgi:hypothetical protein